MDAVYPPLTGEANEFPAGFTASYDNPDISNALLLGMSIGLMVAYMLTNITGLEREVVDARKLNKHRLAKGKHAIPTHSVVRIGHVYNSAGQRVNITSANRRSIPVHMRAAHTRWQHHGPKWMEEHPELACLPGNTVDGHRVLIDAVLVNYKDGTDLRTPLPRMVRM